ncbi:MAG: MmcQ/YjbR family DNA-binding protein [Bacteroidetes bacterium]|nr:MAG: MmcQ/YjbR family DNA-binding protein [Bacteroidota bacterium]
MHIEALREYCLAKAEVTESFPFDEETLVFKVAGKIFAILPLDSATTINLKCAPDYAEELRAQYPGAIQPGWHMNKKHWNTVALDQGLSGQMVCHLIDHSYERVIAGLPKAVQQRLSAGKA